MMAGKQLQAEKYQQVYQQLNPQQQLAVNTIEGPVMVIAGPGTGKTQILSVRIGKILLETDAHPHNILCFTYTDAGVIAMRKRLFNIIGADACKINIYTFQAFCNHVIQENPLQFEQTAQAPISEPERIGILKQLIDGFPKNHPLKRYRGDVYFEITSLQLLFSTMKREGWTPAFMNSKINSYLADLPLRDEYIAENAVKAFKKCDIRTDKIAAEQEKMEKLRAAVNEFDRFEDMMHQRGRYDPDDAINQVIRAFEENALMLSHYQERFRYILIDDYHDISGTQNRLVQLLTNVREKPGIFVAGDDDQRINPFQGADINHMLNFADNYKNDLLTVVLTSNYRSVQPILDVSKAVINHNQERLVNQVNGLSKELITANEQLIHSSHRPVVREYDTQQHEMIHITLEIEKLLQQHNTAPGRIAVIYNEGLYGEGFAEYFSARSIPLYSKRSVNLLHLPMAKKLLLLLRYLSAEHDMAYGGDEMLFEILHFDWFQIPAIEIAQLSVEAAARKYGERKTTLRQLLAEKSNQPPKDLFSLSIHPQLKKAGAIMEKLIADVPNLPLQQLFESSIREAGVLSLIIASSNKMALMQELTALFDFVKAETRRNPVLNLREFVAITDLMVRERIPIPMVQVSGSEKGVNLLTAHDAKGLEFEHVFLTGCNAASWEKQRRPGPGYAMPDTLFSSSTNGTQENHDALRRLFYVALTRAAQHLAVSYSRFTSDGKALEPSLFLAEIQEQLSLPVATPSVDSETAFVFQGLAFQRPQAPEIACVEADWITHKLEKFVMNVTALNSYLKCPLEFYYKNLVRIPSPKNEATGFGSAVHHALQRLFEKMKLNRDEFGPLEEFITGFEQYMHHHREDFTPEQYKRRLEYGNDVLSAYYHKYIHQWHKITSIERNFKSVLANGIPLKGKLDKLEFWGKEANVVDYKTGDPDKALEKLAPPGEQCPNGGDYWRQAVFYKILVDAYDQKLWNVASIEFDFIEPDRKKEYQKRKVVVTPQDITTVSQQIRMVWDKIQARDFYTGCGKKGCHWCQFVKTNNMAVKLHEIAAEDEEG